MLAARAAGVSPELLDDATWFLIIMIWGLGPVGGALLVVLVGVGDRQLREDARELKDALDARSHQGTAHEIAEEVLAGELEL